MSKPKLASSRVVRLIYLTLAWISLALGVIGIFLPGLPTTPLVLLACFLGMRSSPTFYHWLMNHRYFGEVVRQYHDDKTISSATFWKAVVFLWCSTALSIYFFSLLWLKIGLVLMATAVTWHLSHIKQ